VDYETVAYDLIGGVATITLNRPATLNAFTEQMIAETVAAFGEAEQDRSVRCVVLTGNGRAFSSGQDLTEVRERAGQFSIGEHIRQGYNRLIAQMVELEKPIIGAINGIAAGAGCGVALATDIRIAAHTASFMLAFSKIGLVPDSGLNWLLPRLIGYARAYELALTADKLSAEQAFSWGMVNRVVPADQLMETAVAWATKLAAGPTLAYGLTKRAMNQGWTMSLAETLDNEADLQEICGRSHDNKEGIQAFLEKRRPAFTGS
jgi:2-(1,2-epoxy-1,2-dihydrophenyl)acetyl-CoA isomerase